MRHGVLQNHDAAQISEIPLGSSTSEGTVIVHKLLCLLFGKAVHDCFPDIAIPTL